MAFLVGIIWWLLAFCLWRRAQREGGDYLV
jgi:hypothetical protein